MKVSTAPLLLLLILLSSLTFFSSASTFVINCNKSSGAKQCYYQAHESCPGSSTTCKLICSGSDACKEIGKEGQADKGGPFLCPSGQHCDVRCSGSSGA